MVLILFTLIGSVSANDVNTTEVSASDTDDVTSTINVDSADENYAKDLTVESKDLNDTEILSVYDVNYSNENYANNDLNMKISNEDNVGDVNSNSLIDSKIEIKNSSKDLLYGEDNNVLKMNSGEDILGSSSSLSMTTTSWTVSVTVTSSFSLRTKCVVYASLDGGSEETLGVGYLGGGLTYSSSKTFSGSFTPNSEHTVTFRVDNIFEYDSVPSASFTLLKSNPTLTIDTPPTVYYNENSYDISGTCNVNGLTISLDADSTSLGSTTVSNGKWTISGISSTKLDPKTYTLTATSTETTNYNSASATKSITVNKVSPTIKVADASIDYGSGTYNVIGTAKVGSNDVDTGTVTLKQGDITLGTATVSGGSWTVSNIDSTLVNPSSSAYTITATYESNTYYNSASSTGYLTVNKFTPNINIDSASIFYNQTDNGKIEGRIYKFDGDFYNGTIDLYVNGELVGSDITVSSDGYWSYTLSSTTDLAPSSTAYSVGVEWKGNDYTEVTSSTENKYAVNKGITLAIPSADNIDYGRTEYVHVYVSNAMGNGYLSGMEVTLTGTGITGTLTNTTDSNGMVTFGVTGLERGKYDDWRVSVIGNDYYSGRDISVRTFYVQFPLNVIITNITPLNSTYPEEIIVTGFTDADQIPQGNVSLTIGGKTYTGFFDSNGNFTTSLIGVKPGVYTNITAKYNPTVDEFYYRGVESTVSIQ